MTTIQLTSTTAPGRSGALSITARFISRWWALLGLVAIWQLGVSVSGVNEIVMPSPLKVATGLLTEPGVYSGDAAYTVYRALLGLCIGMSAGFLVALTAASSKLLSGLLTPPALIMRSVPVVAMIPVIARLTGYGDSSVLAVTVIISFFPAFVLTTSGLKRVPPGTNDLFQLAGASRLDRLVRLLVPAAVPNLLVALRISAPTSVLAAMVAEFLIGRNGLGELFSQARTDMEMPRAWGAALIATAISVTFFTVAALVERRGNDRFRS